MVKNVGFASQVVESARLPATPEGFGMVALGDAEAVGL
jgi:hypothetical protein